MSDQRTLVTFLLDRTGSMASCLDATIEAFNAYLGTLSAGDKAEVESIEFSLLQFDSSSLDKLCVGVCPLQAPRLDRHNYIPRASTPLIDAAFKTIKAVETALSARDDRPKVIVCIQTDGEENASTEHTMDELNQLIKEKTAAGWQFNFMGAGIDAYKTSRMMGVSLNSTISYDSTNAAATMDSFVANASNSRMFASGRASNTSFNESQRMSAGDVHAKSYGLGGAASAPNLTKPPSRPKSAPAAAKARKPIVDDVKL